MIKSQISKPALTPNTEESRSPLAESNTMNPADQYQTGRSYYPTTTTNFNGDGSVKKFLRKMEHELDAQQPISPKKWLMNAEVRLEGDAERWARRTPEIQNMLSDDRINDANTATKNRFIVLLKQEFPEDDSTDRHVQETLVEIRNLKQGINEGIREYYQRTRRLFGSIGGQDRTNSDTKRKRPEEKGLWSANDHGIAHRRQTSGKKTGLLTLQTNHNDRRRTYEAW